MPVQRDFSGGLSDLPVELLAHNELIYADNCYWARGLRKWGGSRNVRANLARLIGAASYVSIVNDRPASVLVQILTESTITGAGVHILYHDDDSIERVPGDLFWTAGEYGTAVAITDRAWITQSREGIIIGAPGFWPMVCVENADDGAFSLRRIESFDVRDRFPLDFSSGFTRGVADDPTSPGATFPYTFTDPQGTAARFGRLTADGVTFEDWEHNVIWIESLVTFNEVTLTGEGLHTNLTMCLVNEECTFEVVPLIRKELNAEATELVLEWNWLGKYSRYNRAETLSAFTQGNIGRGNYRAFVWFLGNAPVTLPASPRIGGLGGDTFLTVGWEPVRSAISYETRYKVASAADSTYSEWLETTENHVTYRTLMNGTEYRVQVRSKNAAGVSPIPSEVDVTPSPFLRAPGIPTIVFDGYTITPVANPNGGAPSAYEVDFREGNTGGYTRARIVAGSTFTTRLNGEVQARIRAENATDISDWSDHFVRVARPRNIVGSPGEEQIIMSGGSVEGATDYDYRFRRSGEEWTEVTTTAIPQHRFAITGLVALSTYEVQTRARNENGPGPWSISITATAQEEAPPDQPITALPAFPGAAYLWKGRFYISMKILAVANARTYDVQVKHNMMDFEDLATIEAGGHILDLRITPDAGDTVQVRVRGKNFDHIGGWRMYTAHTVMYPRIRSNANSIIRVTKQVQVGPAIRVQGRVRLGDYSHSSIAQIERQHHDGSWGQRISVNVVDDLPAASQGTSPRDIPFDMTIQYADISTNQNPGPGTPYSFKLRARGATQPDHLQEIFAGDFEGPWNEVTVAGNL